MRVANEREIVALSTILLIANAGNSVYAAFGRQASTAFATLYYAGLFWAIAAWIIADSRRLGVALPFDIGWFVLLAWPVVLPYHVFKTRGVRGFATLGGFLAIFTGSYLAGLVLFFAIVVARGA